MLGTDPEFFILNENGKPVPAWRFYPSKHQAVYLNISRSAYFRDGYALEVNTSPTHCRTLMAQDVRFTLSEAIRLLPRGYTLSTSAAVKIDPSDMSDAPGDCQIFGCDPSLSAYSEEPVRVELDAMDHPYRYAGGHMHLSMPAYTFENEHAKRLFVKACDMFIGLPLAYIFNDEANRQRRQYYGQAGEFRIQTYPDKQTGIEYRVPSPQLWNSNKISNLFFGVMRSIPSNLAELKKVWKTKWEDDIREQINNCDVSYNWLQKVVGFYTPALLRKTKDLKVFQAMRSPLEDGYPYEEHGWFEWVQDRFPRTYKRLLGHNDTITHNQARYGDYRATPEIRERLLKAA